MKTGVRGFALVLTLALLALLALGMTLRLAKQKGGGDALGLEMGLPKEAIDAARRAAADLQRHTASAAAQSALAGTSAGAPTVSGGPPLAEVLPFGQAAEGVLDAQEVDEATVQIHKMLEQVSDLVQKDEEAVAGVVEKWVDRVRGG